jgi:hypothetical protein
MEEFGKGKTLLQLINRKQFNELCEKWNLDKGVRKLSTWEQTCTHVMAYVMRLDSLREVEATLGVPRSTFCDANAHRCSGFFQELCELILKQAVHQSCNRKVKKALRQLYILDSTECRVHGSLAKLPLWHLRTISRDIKKASLKIHVVYNLGNEWVDDFRITPNRIHDGKACFKFNLKPHCIYVFDKGYFDIRFWLKIIKSGSHFVTRLKESPARRSLKEQVLKENTNKDGVLWEGTCSRAKSNMRSLPEEDKAVLFRHIIYRDPETKKVFDFVSSDYKASGQEIADIYKKRWAIELLFRWLKSHLNIRYFASKNTNSIEIQIAIAVLVQLLVRLHRDKNKQNLSLWQSLRALRIELIREGLSKSSVQASIGSKYFTRATLVKPRYAS